MASCSAGVCVGDCAAVEGAPELTAIRDVDACSKPPPCPQLRAATGESVERSRLDAGAGTDYQQLRGTVL